MELVYIERETGQKCVEKIYGHKILSFLYVDGFFKTPFAKALLHFLSRIPLVSHFFGYLQKRKGSAKKIPSFIKTYGVNSSEFAEETFSSFNDFFIRKLKKEARPVVEDPNIVVTPADGRYLVYPKFQQFAVKGVQFSLKSFLQSVSGANRYKEGSMAIARLCPSDYHRFHFPCDGIPSKAVLINGPLYSVNPIALRKRISILAENKRMVTEIETERFGTILYVEIGATAVGSIRQTYTPNQPVQKGDEKGYFEFGGSCIVLLFEKGKIVFDSDLVKNTEQGFETRINYGLSLGTSSGI